jgi:ABC-type transport system substrate-binding protein
MRSIPMKLESPAGVLALAAAVVLAAPLACGDLLEAPLAAGHPDDPTPRRGGTLRTASFADVRSLDPAGKLDALADQASRLIYAGLVDYDEEGRLFPDLADHWTVGDDGTTYRFVLRTGVAMQDGGEFTAEDVKRSAERALHPSAPNPFASYYEGIQGFDAFVAGTADHLEGIAVEGRYVVAFHLKEPDAAFLPLLAMPALRPVCASGGSRFSDAWLPCGAGPFKLEPGGWQPGSSLRIVRYDGYFRPGVPYLDAIEWTYSMQLVSQRFRFEDGDLDIIQNPTQADTARFLADPRWKPFGHFEADNEVWGEAMNTRMPPFDNVEVRRAVAAAVDRDHYVLTRPANMTPMTQLLPRGIDGYDPTLEGQHHDLGEALEHMRRAGYPFDPATGKGGWPKPIVYTLTENSSTVFTAQLLQQDLARIGVRLELHLVSWPAFLATTARPGGSAMSPALWTADYADPSALFDPLFETKAIGPEESTNVAFYSNPRYDDLVARARRTLEPAARRALYRAANEILCSDAPWAFSVGIHRFDLHQPYVRGYRPHPVWGLDLRHVFLDRPGTAWPAALDRGRP